MSDTPSRVERVLNLLACLLDTRRALTRDELVREVAGYPDDQGAYRRTFERDKEVLRAMGVPIEMETLPGGEARYRVDPNDYYLPDLGLDDEETAALRVAVSAVALGNRAGEGALMKLGGLSGEPVAPIASLPLTPALATVFDAFRRRAVVTFTHRGLRRVVEPWALVSKWGHWYVVGFDRDRSGVRSFRADRMGDEVEVGDPGEFEVPVGFTPDDHLRDEPWLFGDRNPEPVRLLVDADHVAGIAARVGDDAIVERRPDGAAVLEVQVADRSAMRSFVLGFLEHAEVLEPPAFRSEIISWLRAIQERET